MTNPTDSLNPITEASKRMLKTGRIPADMPHSVIEELATAAMGESVTDCNQLTSSENSSTGKGDLIRVMANILYEEGCWQSPPENGAEGCLDDAKVIINKLSPYLCTTEREVVNPFFDYDAATKDEVVARCKTIWKLNNILLASKGNQSKGGSE